MQGCLFVTFSLSILGPKTDLKMFLELVGSKIQYPIPYSDHPGPKKRDFRLLGHFRTKLSVLQTKTCLLETDNMCLVETDNMCLVETDNMLLLGRNKMSVVARQYVCCGKTRSLLWQDKMCVVARQDLCCGKTRSLLWQDIREAAFGRPPLWIPVYGGWGGGKHSKNIQTYQQMCIEYVY